MPPQASKLVIYRDVFGGWRWEYFGPDGEPRDAPFSYDTRAECVADAKRRGLLAHPRATRTAPQRRVPERRMPVHPSAVSRAAELTSAA